MKMFLTLVLVILSTHMNSQCPENTWPESTIQVRDWTTDYYEMWIEENGNAVLRINESPFYGGQDIQDNTEFLEEDPVDMKDNDPQEGWELLWKKLGTEINPQLSPSFASYIQ